MEKDKNDRGFEREPQSGSVDVIYGPMFCGKSDEMIKRLQRIKAATKLEIVVFAPNKDNRRGKNTINTADGIEFPAISVESSKEIQQIVSKKGDVDIVAIDEAQFFDKGLTGVCRKLALEGKTVIVAGLDTDFRGEPFGPMADLVFKADKVDRLNAICMSCGDSATRTQRMKIIDGKRIPANYNDSVIQVGEEEYEPRCSHCHDVPGKPE